MRIVMPIQIIKDEGTIRQLLKGMKNRVMYILRRDCQGDADCA